MGADIANLGACGVGWRRSGVVVIAGDNIDALAGAHHIRRGVRQRSLGSGVSDGRRL